MKIYDPDSLKLDYKCCSVCGSSYLANMNNDKPLARLQFVRKHRDLIARWYCKKCLKDGK